MTDLTPQLTDEQRQALAQSFAELNRFIAAWTEGLRLHVEAALKAIARAAEAARTASQDYYELTDNKEQP